jgi:hypothetical protein
MLIKKYLKTIILFGKHFNFFSQKKSIYFNLFASSILIFLAEDKILSLICVENLSSVLNILHFSF